MVCGCEQRTLLAVGIFHHSARLSAGVEVLVEQKPSCGSGTRTPASLRAAGGSGSSGLSIQPARPISPLQPALRPHQWLAGYACTFHAETSAQAANIRTAANCNRDILRVLLSRLVDRHAAQPALPRAEPQTGEELTSGPLFTSASQFRRQRIAGTPAGNGH